ncbi:hypothetical protein [Paenibacillus daejeonensis]|uniref:hypothetical protein n=1 Tax=Paenibacillus daejeonensis TaxID=135193 RepID=UPI00037E6937|nr:hypothetical protein [Paenibacillus daejeonensis]
MDSELVTIAILAKDKAYALPLYLDLIERQTYPASKIKLYIRTNNNNDDTEVILQNWLGRVGDRYHEVYFDSSDVVESVQDYKPHEWNQTTLRVLARLREESIQWALARQTHYFVADCDNFIIPETVEALVNTRLPIVGPLLKVDPNHEYSNYHFLVDSDGYFKSSPEYFSVFYQKVKGCIEVAVIHCTYFIRADILQHIRYEDHSKRHEYVIFSHHLRKLGIPQYIDNRRLYGMLTFASTPEKIQEKRISERIEQLISMNKFT